MIKNFFEIKNVTFSIGGKDKVNDVNISIENEGDIICILGPSGIGKTTMLRTIAGLEKINKGQIILPLFIFSRPAIVLSIVVFPIPEGPKIQMMSPSFTIEMLASYTLFLPPIAKVTFLISKKFLLICIS